ncbi:MAG: histidine kinase [Sphaerochaetaceae bacterium]
MNSLFLLCGVFLLLLLIAFVAMFVNYYRQQQLHVQFVNRVNASNDILVSLHAMQDILNTYRKDESPMTYAAYCDQSKILEDTANTYMKLGVVGTDALNQMQYLKWFNRYQQTLLENAQQNTEELPATISYVLIALEARVGEMHSLFQRDISTGYQEYKNEEKGILRKLNWLAAVFFVICIGVVFAFAGFVQSINSLLSRCISNLDHLSQHDWEAEDLQGARYTEFSNLFIQINHMKKELQGYFARLKEQAEIERQLSTEKLENERQRSILITTQLQALRSQMNPHFLFNALQQIGMASLVEPPQKVMQLVESTGKILRYALTRQTNYVSFHDEMEIVRQYLFL